MKQYHYEELHNMKDLNLFQRITETGNTKWIIVCGILLLLSLIIVLLCLYTGYENIGLFVGIIGIASLITIIAYPFVLLKQYDSVGYYRAEAKVISIDKQEKVGEGTQYSVKCRYMTGNIEDKKTKPIKIKTRQKGIKNGDHVMIKTPEMEFKGGEDQRVSDHLLITERERAMGEEWSVDDKIPKHVDTKDLKLEKRSR